MPLTARALVELAGGLRAATALLSRLPVGRAPISAAARRWAAAWFPLVGAGLGAAGAGVLMLARPTGPFLAATLAVAALLLLTGAFHEDGLADTADALGGASDRDRLFAILKDSRIGTYGAAALCMSLLVRVGALARLEDGAPAALVLAQSLSRIPPVWLMASLPHVTPVARSTDVTRPHPLAVSLASVVAVLGVGLALARGWIGPGLALAIALLLGGVFVLAAWRFAARAGGITGDFLGATQQVAEVALLLACVAGSGGD